ncbi:MAG: hypothetical protein A2498_16950 [Lentisphaerae bacterium RIFOXYC12_FULL_60_16]|nr:MAG: hypothetical protein A2498_16950 [Lentisphaerae bacterium RIFOXYC12_FULL_60_16]OGV75423.1 MAG: hypothetical protein A2340_03695 [Lentisphaerae bacterium RIFOXYB12_FULL_60_10]
MTTRKKYDFTRPDTRELRDRITHGVFLREGNLVAFPLCFPGASTPLPPDESQVTALSVAPSHMVYGGTSGRAAHVFVGMFHGVTGCVLALGEIRGATAIPAVCCTPRGWVAACNGPAGGRLVRGAYVPMPFDLIQEWEFTQVRFEDLGTAAEGEPVVHAVAEPGGGVLAATSHHLVRYRSEPPTGVETLAEVVGSRLSPALDGSVYGLCDARSLWRWDAASGRLDKRAVALPADAEVEAGLRWAVDPFRRRLYLTDQKGDLFILEPAHGVRGPVARTPLAPVTSLAATLDGRVYGTCGEGMEHFFRYTPGTDRIDDIGMAVSVLERRRYGYQYADAAMGRDGQLFFGENDTLGHLWIYFPRIEPSNSLI